MSKSAAIGNETAKVIAKEIYPDLSPAEAMSKWLETPVGRQFYADHVAMQTRAEQGLA